MKTLVLLRHAKSSWDNPALPDFDRPLGPRGVRDAPAIAKRLAAMKLSFDRILLSPSRRTLDTWAYFSEALQFDLDCVVPDGLLYEASGKQVLEQVAKTPESVHTLLVVGHAPGLPDAASFLTGRAFDKFPTCGCYGIELPISNWAALQPAVGRELFFLTPKDK